MKSFQTLLFLFYLAGMQGCIGYLIQAGSGQLEIIWNKKPISDLILDPKTPPETKKKLLLVQEVREFARSQIGLEVENTYTEISMLDRNVLAWNVTASKPLKLEPKLHYFPITGNIPYLGYFSKNAAIKKSMQLKKEGWETLISEVSGYSTLGWFDDPLISTQLNYSDWYLAELVLHESTHATIWFPGDVSFNESFANFTGKLAARQFFVKKLGKNSQFITRNKAYQLERKKLNQILRRTSHELKTLYASGYDDKTKLQKKNQIISALKKKLEYKSGQFKYLNLKKFGNTDFNNAYFLGFLRYKSGNHFFYKEWNKCKKNWKCFIKNIRLLEKLSSNDRKKKIYQRKAQLN